VETCLEVARRLQYLTQRDYDELMTVLDGAGQLLSGLFRSLPNGKKREEN
jgi:hypothetical protein